MLARRHETLERLSERLVRAESTGRAQRAQRLAVAAKTLHAVSPLATLARGYAVVRDDAGRTVTDVAQLETGDAIAVSLRDGRAEATVEKVVPDGS